MKRIFLSVPMKGRTNEDVAFTINKMKNVITTMFDGEEIEFIDNILNEEECKYHKQMFEEAYGNVNNERLVYLGLAIQKMACCDYIVTIESKYNAGTWKGVYVEDEVSRLYKIPKIRLDDPDGKIYLPDVAKKIEEAKKELNGLFGVSGLTCEGTDPVEE